MYVRCKDQKEHTGSDHAAGETDGSKLEGRGMKDVQTGLWSEGTRKLWKSFI